MLSSGASLVVRPRNNGVHRAQYPGHGYAVFWPGICVHDVSKSRRKHFTCFERTQRRQSSPYEQRNLRIHNPYRAAYTSCFQSIVVTDAIVAGSACACWACLHDGRSQHAPPPCSPCPCYPRFIEGANYTFALIFTLEACVKVRDLVLRIRSIHRSIDRSTDRSTARANGR